MSPAGPVVQKSGIITDLFLAGIVLSVVVILILPLPSAILDLLLIANLCVGIVVLLVSLYVIEPLEFASFPSLLLITTLFRLALNVATSRAILLYHEAGHVIEAFAKFVIGGNYVVGLIIFIILTIIQFVVITEGSKRVAEVA